MGERDSYAPGTFCWADLGTTDADAAKAFYTRVFGWEAVDSPVSDDGTYTTFKLDGRDVAALYEMGEQERSSLMPHWSSYVAVEDVDALAPRVRELGGEVLAEPVDVAAAGRVAARRGARERPRLHVLERARVAGPGPGARLLHGAAGLDGRARGVGLRRDQARRRHQRRDAGAPGRRA